MSYKLYKVKVEGKEYQVEVEELTDYPQEMMASSRPAGSVASASAASAAASQAAKAPQSSGSGTPVKAPLQGSILGLAVKVGDSVKKGDVLLKIEALKMENEVFAPSDGVIGSVNVQDGQRVASGDVLCTIR